jgi:hypothetical protein
MTTFDINASILVLLIGLLFEKVDKNADGNTQKLQVINGAAQLCQSAKVLLIMKVKATQERYQKLEQ